MGRLLMKFRRIPTTITPGVEPFDGKLVLVFNAAGNVNVVRWVDKRHYNWQFPNEAWNDGFTKNAFTHYAPLEFEVETDDN
jgi:hypothetical protein